MQRKSTEERFWAKVEKTAVCWIWQGARNRAGYGNFGVRAGLTVSAHRFAYETMRGVIPDGLQIDHLCRNTFCVNPEHMEAVTQRVNNSRTPNALAFRMTCPQGHPYDVANTRMSAGGRFCRTCDREKAKAKRARLKAQHAMAAAQPLQL